MSDTPDHPDNSPRPHHAGNPFRLHFTTVTTAVIPAHATHRPSTSGDQVQPGGTAPGLGGVRRRRSSHQHPPACLDLESTIRFDSDGATHSSIANVVVFGSPSAPIPIPGRSNPSSRPTTPLTGRAAQGANFPFARDTPRKSRFGESADSPRTPSSLSSRKSTSPRRAGSPFRSPPTMPRDHASRRLLPPSPLLPAMPLSPLLPYPQHGRNPDWAGQHNRYIPVLPRLHPANFQLSHRMEGDAPQRTRASALRDQFSDAQHKLHKYQRDLIANATRPARLMTAQTLRDPAPPRLHPLGSPGPVTPLTLEEKGDYLTAGAAASAYRLDGGVERELVEAFIRQEQERMKHGGMQSDRPSAAVSPAGGHG